MIRLFPSADLFGVVDFLQESDRAFLQGKAPQVTFIQRLPLARSKFRQYLPLMPLAIEQLDLSSYDLILSSHHAVAKGVITGPNQLHISYVHSPMRYAWDLQHQYLRESGLDRGLKGWITRYLLHRLRLWDQASANRVDHFLSNSEFIKKGSGDAIGAKPRSFTLPWRFQGLKHKDPVRISILPPHAWCPTNGWTSLSRPSPKLLIGN